MNHETSEKNLTVDDCESQHAFDQQDFEINFMYFLIGYEMILFKVKNLRKMGYSLNEIRG